MLLGKRHGMSRKAGELAVAETALSRMALPLPILLFPPLIMHGIDRAKILPPRLRFPVELAIITGCLRGALPLAIGLFPQEAAVAARRLEPEFRDLKDEQGQPIKTLYYDKGL